MSQSIAPSSWTSSSFHRGSLERGRLRIGPSSGSQRDGVSVNDIIHDLQLRKERRLRNGDEMAFVETHSVSSTITSAPKHSRFLKAAHSNRLSQDSTPQHIELEKYRLFVVDKNKEIKSLRKQLEDKEEFIKSLQYSLLQQNEQTPQLGRGQTNGMQLTLHRDTDSDSKNDIDIDIDTDSRSKGMSKTPSKQTERGSNGRDVHRRRQSMDTEKWAMDNVRWELRSSFSKMASAQHEVARLLQSVGDSSEIHGPLKRIQRTLSMHKRRVSALEQTLNIDPDGNSDVDHDHDSNHNLNVNLNVNGNPDGNREAVVHRNGHGNDLRNDHQRDIGLLIAEYNKLRAEMTEIKLEQKQWTETKEELESVKKRNVNLMKMLDRMSDEKLEMTLKIEDLQTLLNKHGIPYDL